MVSCTAQAPEPEPEPSPGPTTAPGLVVSPSFVPATIRFADDLHGVAIGPIEDEAECAGGPCLSQILITEDGGLTWEAAGFTEEPRARCRSTAPRHG